MGAINGTTMLLLVDGVAVAGAKSNSIHWDQNLMDTSSKSSGGWATHKPGQRSWGGSCDSWYDPTSTLSTEQLFDLINTRDETAVLEVAQIDGTGGGEVYRGVASIDHLEMTMEMEAPVAVSFSFVGNGAPAKGTVVSS